MFIFTGCDRTRNDNISSNVLGDQASGSGDVTGNSTNPFEANGLEIIDEITIEGDTGYAAKDKNGKECMVLQGSAYNMGYQIGALRPEATKLMTSDFIFGVIGDFIGVEYEQIPMLFDFVKEEMILSCNRVLDDIPQYLIEEMHGLADGATSKGYDVAFEDVLLLNEGIDALFSLVITGVLPSLIKEKAGPGEMELIDDSPIFMELAYSEGKNIIFPEANPFVLGCNEFVASGNATVDNKIYHGRDFMFPTGHLYQDLACMAVYIPHKELGHSFSTITAPGFVGQATAMNSKGLSMGMDVVMGVNTSTNPGLGCLLVCRDIIQNCSNLDQAVERMKEQHRGVSWLFILADDERSMKYTNGIVAEVGLTEKKNGDSYTVHDLLADWIEIPLWPWINKLDSPIPDRGVMVRTQEYVYPSRFKNVNAIIPVKDGEEEKKIGVYFPDQLETWTDVVLTTNHYVIPRMVFASFHPWLTLVYDRTSSYYRYEKLHELMEAEYGKIDYDTAKNLIDFLNPNSVYGDLEFYDHGGEIEGHHVLVDNLNLTIDALFGYYGTDTEQRTPWMKIDLKPFIKK